MQDAPDQKEYRRAQRLGLILGGVLFVGMLLGPAPEALGVPGWRTAAVAVLMSVWWMTEAIPIPATALLPLGLFPILGVLSPANASAPYANDQIFLFMGGFLMAVTMERWGLHKRIALRIMTLVGTSPNRLVLGFMLATAFLSMWISNTATAAMMLPIAIAVGEMFRPQDHEGRYEFGIALMLGMAYAASIGGVATLIGTPPNAILAAASSEILGREIGFFQWMGVGLPLVAVMLPLTWLLLVRFLYPPGAISGDASSIISAETAALGPASRGERITASVFVLTALAWVFRSEKAIEGFTIPGLQTWLPGVGDATIA
jgi:sodium-dependent dicarboxylate transporter 2/3/5